MWVRDVDFTPRRDRTAARRRGPNTLQRRKQAEIARLRDAGRERIGQLSNRDLLITGVALYAGEGGKTDGSVEFSNTNAAMVRLFCTWLRTFFDVDETRLRARLYLHEGLDLDAALRHWSRVTCIPSGQFTRPYRATPDQSDRQSEHAHGCVTVRYGCSYTHPQVMGLVHALLDPAVLNSWRAVSEGGAC